MRTPALELLSRWLASEDRTRPLLGPVSLALASSDDRTRSNFCCKAVIPLVSYQAEATQRLHYTINHWWQPTQLTPYEDRKNILSKGQTAINKITTRNSQNMTKRLWQPKFSDLTTSGPVKPTIDMASTTKFYSEHSEMFRCNILLQI